MLVLFTQLALASASLSLDGEWQMWRAASGDSPPKSPEWTSVKVPSFVPHSTGLPFTWFRRSFTVPAGLVSRHLFLRFEAVKFVSEVYLNGKKVGGHFGGWEPFEFDVTGIVRLDGPNNLLVRVQDVSGVIAQPLDYKRQGGGVRLIDQVEDAIVAPVGSQYYRVGIWQPVRLVARGDVYVEDVFIKTSVRKRELDAEVTLRNLSDKPRVVRLGGSVANWPEHDGRPLLALGEREVRVAARASATAALRRAWPDPHLWSLDSPALYVLSVLLEEGGKPIETSSQRFGFREFWCEGPKLMLNGVPIHFLATAGHPRGELDDGLSKRAALDFYKRIRQAGCVAMRLHANVWPEWWYEAADEVGMPIIMESALFCYSRSYALNKPAFWKNYHDHLAAIIRHKRNHPAIVMYSLENEILHCGGERFAKDCERRLAEAGRMVKQLDPTRPIMFDADGDPSTSLGAGPEGVADVVNLHYPLDFDRQNLWPNSAWWLEKGTKVRGWPHKFFAWDRKKPLYFGEFLHLRHYVQPDNYTTLLGDDAYRGHNWAMAHCKALAWAMQIQAYRGCDLSGMCPWTLTETGPFPSPDNPRYMAVKRAYAPIAAFIRERDTRFYAGETVARTVDLYNDTLHPAKLTFEWELREDKKVFDSGRREFDTRPAQRVRFAIQPKMPADAAPWLDLSLVVRIRLGGRVAFEGSQRYRVFPRLTLGGLTSPLCGPPSGMRIALFEGPDATVGAWLRASGRSVTPVRDLAKLPEADVLLIGPHALDRLKPSGGMPTIGSDSGPQASVAAFVRRGGCVLVLEQDSYDCGFLPARLVDRACTVAFRRADWGPRLGRLIRDDDLRFWRGDHVVARKTIAKPDHGGSLALADSGGPDGLVYLPLLEVRDGKGSYLLSQLLIGEKLGKEPMAQVMLEALLLRASAARASRALALVQEGLHLADALGECGATYADVSGKLAAADLAASGVLLAEADAAEVARNVVKLRRFVEAGGTLLLHAGTRDGTARLAKLFPEPILAQRNSSIPVNIARWDQVIDGLTNQELYWYGDRSGLSWRVRTPLAADVCDHVIGTGLPDPNACRTFEAEQMAADHGEPDFRPREAYLYATAGLKTAINFPKTGEYAFIVRGRGTPVSGVYPQIALSIDGRRCGSVTTAGEQWGEYFLTAEVGKGKHEVTLAFVNDAYAPERGEDRNVALDWLRLGPVPPTKAKRLLNPPALVKLELGKGFILLDQVRWDKRPGDERAMRYLSNILTNLDCGFRSPVGALTLSGDAFKPKAGARLATVRNGVVHMGTNGTVATRVRFATGGTYSFAVRVRGTKAAGEFPKIALAMDRREVGEVMLRRPGWHNVGLSARVSAGDHEVALSFTNDYYNPPEDRNLRIAGLRIRKLR